jgi:hypothetical protein
VAGHHEDHHVQTAVPFQGKGRHGQESDCYLHPLDGHDDARFGQPVRQASGGSRKEQKREHEGRSDRSGDDSGLVGPFCVDQAEDDQQLEDVVVHRPQKLGGVETAEGMRELGYCFSGVHGTPL